MADLTPLAAPTVPLKLKEFSPLKPWKLGWNTTVDGSLESGINSPVEVGSLNPIIYRVLWVRRISEASW